MLDVALAMRHRLQWFIRLRAQGPRKAHLDLGRDRCPRALPTFLSLAAASALPRCDNTPVQSVHVRIITSPIHRQ